jgi:hypothetical protein
MPNREAIAKEAAETMCRQNQLLLLGRTRGEAIESATQIILAAMSEDDAGLAEWLIAKKVATPIPVRVAAAIASYRGRPKEDKAEKMAGWLLANRNWLFRPGLDLGDALAAALRDAEEG